jgi:hypothetical protein
VRGRHELRRVFRVLGGVYAASLLFALAIACAGPQPAAGDGPVATFAPGFTPAPSPTVVTTALPPPISRPEDARGIQQTSPPLASPSSFVTPQPPPALWLSTAPSFTVPCALHGNRIFVPVVVNGKPVNFLLDSAATFSSIDPSSAPSRDVPIKLATVQIGALRFNRLVAGVMRISAPSRAALGEPADGVIGQELFSRYPVLIDYSGCSVTIFRDGVSAKAALAAGSRSIPLHLVRGLPTVDATFDGGGQTQLLLDTASDGDVDITREFAVTSLVAFSVTSSAVKRWLPSGALSGENAHVRSVALGPVIFNRPNIAILAIRVPSGAGVAGHVGNGLLSRSTLLLDEPDLTAAFGAEKAQ